MKFKIGQRVAYKAMFGTYKHFNGTMGTIIADANQQWGSYVIRFDRPSALGDDVHYKDNGHVIEVHGTLLEPAIDIPLEETWVIE